MAAFVHHYNKEGVSPMSLYQKFIQNERLRRFCVLALIIFVLYLEQNGPNEQLNR
jgi:hypothetical protein